MESLLVPLARSVPENRPVPLAGTTPAPSKDHQKPAFARWRCASNRLPPTAVQRPGIVPAGQQRQHLRLVGECPDARPHPSHQGRPPRAAAGPATSDSSLPAPSSRGACHPYCDNSDAGTCFDPTHGYFTFKRVGLQYFLRTHSEGRRIRESSGSNYSENVLKKYSNHLKLRKVG